MDSKETRIAAEDWLRKSLVDVEDCGRGWSWQVPRRTAFTGNTGEG